MDLRLFNQRNPSEAPRFVGDLRLWDAVFHQFATVREVEELFLAEPELPGCVLMEEERLVGLLSRKAFTDALSRPFARDLFLDRPLRSLLRLEVVDTMPLRLAEETPIPQAAEAALARSHAMAYEPLLVDWRGSLRVLEVDVVMRVQAALLEQAVRAKDALLREVRQGADELRATLADLERVRDRLLKSEERLEAEVAKRTQELQDTNADLLRQQAQIEEELKFARSLQQAILPDGFPVHEHVRGHAFMRAARMIGGDFYDIFRLDEHRLGLVVADISGKGVPAALFMVLVRTVLQEVALQSPSPAHCLAQTNRQLRERNPLWLFVTLVYGVLDLRTGLFTFCNGGHVMPYVLRADGSIEVVAEKPSPLVGLIDAADYTDLVVQLRRGDGLVLVTDGVSECFNAEGEAFGEDRLLDFLAASQAQSTDSLIRHLTETLDRFSEGIPASDDVTALALRFGGTEFVAGFEAPTVMSPSTVRILRAAQ